MDVMQFQRAKIGSKVKTKNLDVGKITSFGYLKKNDGRVLVDGRRTVGTANGVYLRIGERCISAFYRYSELLEFVEEASDD
jgi:hypothetical protein